MLDKNHTSKEWEQLWKDLDKTKNMPTHQETAGKVAQTKNIKASNFGIGASMMGNYQDPLQGLAAEIRGGAGHIEFSPNISGQGAGYHTFTKISAEKRQALRELKKINKTTISTHAHAGVTGLTGFDSQRFMFNDDQRQHSVNEIRKAIDFAADVAEGGSITFHAGNFARPLSGQKMGGEFEIGSDEKNQMMFAVIDKETKKYVEDGIFRADQKMVVPVFDYSKEKEIKLHDLKGDQYVVPGLKENVDTGSVQTKEFDNFRQYAAWLAKEDVKFQEQLKKANINPKDYIKEQQGKKDEILDYYVLEMAAKKRFEDTKKIKLSQALNNISRQTNTTEGEIKEIDKMLAKASEITKEENAYIMKETKGRNAIAIPESQIEAFKMKNNLDDDDFYSIKKGTTLNQIKSNHDLRFESFYAGEVSADQIDNRKKELELEKETAKQQIQQEFDKLIGNDKYFSVSDFAAQQNKKSMGQLGLELYEKNKAMEAKGHKGEKLYFAIENLFPENYGAHPEELLKTIEDSREAMAQELKNNYNFDDKKSKTIAEESIKATFDTGHLHMWKKYFKRNEKETDDQWDSRFNKWALEQTKKLVDAGVIGNVHLADNFGFDDDHLTLGQGSVPIKEYLEMFDKAIGQGKITGKFSVEGFDDSGERHGVREAWKTTGTQIFKGQQATERWTNPSSGGTYNSSFAHSDYSTTGFYNKPHFVFGKYSPDHEEWSPWSDTTME